MLDAISFEKRGIPAAVVITEPFRPTGTAMAALWGLPDYPLAVIPHPVGSLTAKEVVERADAIAPRVAEILRRAIIRPSGGGRADRAARRPAC